MFYGPGAGSEAAGSAVVGDIIEIARNVRFGASSRIQCTCFDEREMLSMDSVKSKNYVRIVAEDKPRVLAAIATEFANHDVSIESVIQKPLSGSIAEIVWLTHEASEPNMRSALDAVSKLEATQSVASWIRVEE
jgi:homoserine dehydrogenase